MAKRFNVNFSLSVGESVVVVAAVIRSRQRLRSLEIENNTYLYLS